MPFFRRSALVLLGFCTLSVFLLVGCSKQPLTGSFAGHVSNSNALIAFATSDNKVIAYVCDSQSIAAWFSGDLTDNGTFTLTNTAGAHLQGTLTHDKVTGTFTLPNGQPLAFTAGPASGDAGLYRGQTMVDSSTLTGGWVVLANGEQAGAVIQNNTIIETPHLNTGQPTVALSNGAKIAAQRLNGFIDNNVNI